MSKVWLITGAGRGFGLAFTRAALARGDKVAATVRDRSALDELMATHGNALLPLELDVTDRAAVFAAVAEAKSVFGRIDVVVNNAGYGLFGAVEEISEQQLRDQLEVNLFGVLHVVQAVLPVLREQGAGHIIQISTIGGIAAFPSLGGYHASKWALEGLTESLAQEVARFGIKVTLVEPGGYATDWRGSSAVHAQHSPHYDAMRKEMAERDWGGPSIVGDPVAAAEAMLKLVDAENPPLRLPFGILPVQYIPVLYQQRLESWKQWEELSREAHG